MITSKRPLRHFVSAAALQDYLICPQRYAYRWLYDVQDTPQTSQQWFMRLIRRTALTIVREKLEGKSLGLDKAWLLLDWFSRGTLIRDDVTLIQRARDTIGQFNEQLHQFRIVSLGETRLVTLTVAEGRQCDIQLQADFTIFWKKQRTHILLTPPLRNIEISLGSLDSQSWATCSLHYASAGKIRKSISKTSETQPEVLGTLVTQGLRGLVRKIVWPYKDSRCQDCAYMNGCTTNDSSLQHIRDSKYRQKVRSRFSKSSCS